MAKTAGEADKSESSEESSSENDEEDTESDSGHGRRVTDKHGNLLFIFVFIIWTTSWFYAVYYYDKSDSERTSGNITYAKNETKLTHHYLWGRSWLFDAITCNLAFISAHYEEGSGSIVIVANALMSIGLITYSISSMRSNFIRFHSQLDIALIYLMCFTLIFRLLAFTVNHFEIESFIDILALPSHEKLPFWLMPEMIVLMIWHTKKLYTIIRDIEMPLFIKFQWVLVLFTAGSLAIFCTLYIYTMNIAYHLGWDCALTYVIVGGSCYIGLTVFYYLSIVIGATGYYAAEEPILPFDDEVGCYREVHLRLRDALVWVARYHFGTACYHATLIVPRVHALFIMNEPEFKIIPKLAKITDRIYATQCKLHDLTLMGTTMYSSNYSEAMRKLLRHYGQTDLGKNIACLQGFSQTARCLLAIFMGTNNLLLMTLWFYGLNDPNFSLATWVFYLRVMIIFYVPMKFSDMAWDPTQMIRNVHFTFINFDQQTLTHYQQMSSFNDQLESFMTGKV